MMRTIQLGVACVAVLVATAGQVQAGIIVGITDSNIQSSVNDRFFSNLFSGMDVFGRRTVGGSWTLDNWSSRISANGGIFSSGALTASSLVGTDWLVASTNTPWSSDELDLAQSFVVGGGNLVVIGEGASFPDIIANANAVLAAVGSSMIFLNAESIGLVTIHPDPLTTGVTDFVGNYAGQIDGGTALVSYSNGGNVVAYESVAVAAVPEPSSIAVFAIGACVAGVGVARRRRRDQQPVATA